MATGNVIFYMTPNPTGSIVKGGDSITLQINSISGSFPSGSYVSAVSMTFSAIKFHSTSSNVYFTLTTPASASYVYATTESNKRSYSTGGSTTSMTVNFNSVGPYADYLKDHTTGTYIGFHFYGISNTANAFTLSSGSSVVITVQYTTTVSGQPSTGTLSDTDVMIGDDIDLYISGDPGYTHNVVWTLGSASISQNYAAGVTTATLSVPSTWAEQIPNSYSRRASVKLTTKYGSSVVGSPVSYSFDVYVPNTYIPVIGSVTSTLSASNPTVVSWNKYVHDYSYMQLSANNVTVSPGASITSFTFRDATTSEILATSTDGTATVAVPAPYSATQSDGSYSVTISCVATDSRGMFSTEKTVTITAYSYANPVLSRCTAVRSDSSGVAQDTGTSITINATFSYSPVGGDNSASITVSYKDDDSAQWIQGYTSQASSLTTTVTATFARDALSSSVNYSVMFEATDSLSTTTKTIALGTLGYTVFFKKGGLGIGIGMITTKNVNTPALEISDNWGVYYGETDLIYNILDRIVYSNSEPSSPVEDMIWLKPASGSGGGGGDEGSSSIAVANFTGISSLPYTGPCAVNSNYVLLQATLSDESAMVGDWTVTPGSGTITISGNIDGQTDITLVMGLPSS